MNEIIETVDRLKAIEQRARTAMDGRPSSYWSSTYKTHFITCAIRDIPWLLKHIRELQAEALRNATGRRYFDEGPVLHCPSPGCKLVPVEDTEGEWICPEHEEVAE